MATPPNTLLEPVSTYPVFEANQLLSFRDLNEVRDYLDQQTRLTRVCLTGTGIVCGLVPSSKGNSIVISAGCGVTTEGFLIQPDRCALTHHQPIKIPRGAFLGKETSPIDTIDAFELFEEASEDSTALTAAFIKGKVVALLLECNDEKNEACLDDCDDKGTEREFNIRRLLIENKDASDIVEENFNPILENQRRRYPDWTLEDLLIGRYGLMELYLERFGHTVADGDTPAQVNLTEIKSYKDFLNSYSAIIQASATRVDEALKRAHVALSPLFSSEVPGALPNLPADHFDVAKLIKTERRLEIQYVYDHLADLILAYNEFRRVAFDLMDVCRPETGWFPKHLFLGAPLAPGEELPIPPSTLRTPYVQPPVYNGNRARVDAARLMFQRLRVLMKSFAVPDPTEAQELRITPSRWSNVPLSARAIPYYYEPKDLHHVWNADRHRKARDHQMHSYFRIDAPGNGSNPPYDDPLVFDFEGHDFYRIEGHIGLEKQEAFESISKLRESYNLGFDLVVVKLGEVNAADFDHDCEFQLLQVQYTKLRTDLACALYLQKLTDPVMELLAELVEKLDDFDYASFEKDFNAAMLESDKQVGTCLLGYDRQAFLELSELHRARRKEVLEQTLFHQFAKRHPGMEHKAGVPRGGTFILVYHERQIKEKEREELLSRITPLGLKIGDFEGMDFSGLLRQTVVADFCLPYLCCADCPPTAYVLARPRPTFLIDPMAFCANEDQEYDFVVAPPGGVIMGPGTHRDGSRYYFVPSDSDTGVESGNVEVTYSVDGADATLTLQIQGVPQATFDQIPETICYGASQPLTLVAGTPIGGKFTTDIDDGNDQLGIREYKEQFFFDATIADVPRNTPIRISYTVTGENGCTGVSQQTTQVLNEPDADFTGLREFYCRSDDASQLVPVDRNLKHSVFEGMGVSGDRFHPAKVEFKDLQIEVTVTHTATDDNGCRSSLVRATTVFRQQSGRFAIGDPRRSETGFIFPIRSIHPVQLEDQPLRYHFSWFDVNDQWADELRANSKDFELSVPRAQIDGLKVLKVVLVVINGPCKGIPLEKQIQIPFGDQPGTDEERLVLERRLVLNRERLAKLAAKHEELDHTKTFQLADGLLEDDPNRSTKKFVNDVGEFVNTLARGYKQLNNDERREGYRSLAKIAADTMIDRVAVEPPNTATREKAAKHLQKLSDVELDLAVLRDDWLDGELAGVLDDARVDVARTLFD